MVNHYSVLGKFSEEVRDYTNKNIFERILTPEAQLLGKIVDPYSYLRNGRFDDMPKLILNSAGDEFFVPDSSRFYFQDLPGTQNYLRYIPNTGHGLDDRAVSSRKTFYDAILHDRPLPRYSWTVEQDGSIHVEAETAPSQVLLWQKINVNKRDFRSGYTPQVFWFSTPLTDQGGGTYVGNVATPPTGAVAYLIELTFPNSVPGFDPYVFTTEARIKSNIPLAAWPYATGDDAAALEQLPAPEAAPAAQQAADERSRDVVAAALTTKFNGNEFEQELFASRERSQLDEDVARQRSVATSQFFTDDEPLSQYVRDAGDEAAWSFDAELDEELLELLL
jgi:PhoPQ-activated pathogenicity-related protein